MFEDFGAFVGQSVVAWIVSVVAFAVLAFTAKVCWTLALIIWRLW